MSSSLPPARPRGARGPLLRVPKCAFSGCGGKAVRCRDRFDPISEVANGLATTERARQGARRMGQPVPVTKVVILRTSIAAEEAAVSEIRRLAAPTSLD